MRHDTIGMKQCMRRRHGVRYIHIVECVYMLLTEFETTRRKDHNLFPYWIMNKGSEKKKGRNQSWGL